MSPRGLNLARIWLWWGCDDFTTDVIPKVHVSLYLREGPGLANEGKPKARWYNPLTREYGPEFTVERKQETQFIAPDNNDWALLVKP